LMQKLANRPEKQNLKDGHQRSNDEGQK